MNPRGVQMKVGKRMPATGSRCVMEFDAGETDPVEIFEAFERMLAAWPASRIPPKNGVRPGTVCGCGQAHGNWACSHCTPAESLVTA